MDGDSGQHRLPAPHTSVFPYHYHMPAAIIAAIVIAAGLVVIGVVILVGWCWWKLLSASFGGAGEVGAVVEGEAAAAGVVELTAVAAQPAVLFPPAQHASEEPREACYICLDEFAAGDELRQLPCHHYFHRSCLAPLVRPYCPICNLSLEAQS